MKIRNIKSLKEIDDLIIKEMEKRDWIQDATPSPAGFKTFSRKKNKFCEKILSVSIKFKLKAISPHKTKEVFSDVGRNNGDDYVGMADWNYKKNKGLIEIIHRKYFKTNSQYYKTMFHEVGHLIGEKFRWPMSDKTHEIFAESFACYVMNYCGLLTKKIVSDSANYFLDEYASGSPSRGTMRAKMAFDYLMQRCDKKLS